MNFVKLVRIFQSTIGRLLLSIAVLIAVMGELANKSVTGVNYNTEIKVS